MVMRVLRSLEKADMYDFLAVFPKSSICAIHLILYNGTVTRTMELPHGSTASYYTFELRSDSVEMITKDLERVDHNQVQTCEAHLQKDGEYGIVSLSLLHSELSFHEKPNVFSTDKLLEFARKKELRKVTLSFE